MEKRKSRKFYAAALAAVLAVTAVPRIELGTTQLAGAVQSVLDFQQQLAAMKAPQTDAVPFVSLHYDAEQDMLYRDGKPVGDRCGEYAVIDGNVMLSAKAAGVGDSDAGYVSLEQAAKRIGCTVTEEKDGVTVTSPFDSACLIVRAEGEIAQYGAIDCVENRDGVRVLQYATPADAYHAYQQLITDARVDFVEPSKTVSLAAAGAEEKAYSYITDSNTDWGVAAIGAESYNQKLIANNETLPEIVVAVVDTGIYFDHERFVNRIAGQGAAFLDEVSYTVDDEHGHGTHCAGIIVGATTDNVKILPVRALDAEGYGSSVGIYCGMLYAMEQGADVVSMSLGISGESPLVQYTVDQLYDAGIVCCVAAGNESMDADNVTPARAEHAITVGAVDEYKELAYFSNYGPGVDLVAPGVDVWSADITSPDSFVYMSGTSMATPYVAACSAMVLSADETLSVDDVDSYLKANAIDLGAAGKDDMYGYGLVYMGDFVFNGTYCAAPEIHYPEVDPDALDPVDITISCSTEGAEIYYTLDGTTPDQKNGTLYTKGFTVSESTVVKAVSYLNDRVGGYSEVAIVIGGMDIFNALEIKNGVLVAYHGILTELDLTEHTDITAIGDSAFAGNTKIEELLLADTVTSIGDHAFEGCRNLFKVTASGVTAVGEAAFRNSRIMRLETAPLTVLGEAAFENCTNLWLLELSEELTEIPARFLKDSYFSNTLTLPNVTVIGDEAFVNCTGIQFSEINWGAITAVGKEAFYSCDLQDVYADFDALQSIGEGAFRQCYNLAGITLPETITELPAYLLADVRWLEYLEAPGVTVVNDYALALNSAFGVETRVEIPFAQITSVGESAFLGFFFPESVEFTALNEMGRHAFAATRGGMLSFPALKQVAADGFFYAQSPVLFFENVTSIGECAFEDATAIVVLSDACTTIDASAFYGSTIAAPAESFAAEFASINQVTFMETPTLYAPTADYVFDLLDEKSIEGYGLGFGMQYQWYDGEGNIIEGATDYHYSPNLQPGETESFILRLTDANGDYCGSIDYSVTVNPVKITADLAADTVILSDYDALMEEWDAAFASEDYDFDSSFTAYRYYSFTPDADGTYYFHLSDCYSSGATITLYGADLEQNFFDTTKYLTALLNAGETYTLVIRYTDQSAFAGALGVSTTAPEDYYIMGGSWWMDTAEFENGIVPEKYPYVPELKLFNPNFASSGLVLKEGDDLLIMMTDNDAPGRMTVYAFGQGRFIGAASELNIMLLEPVEEDEPITVIPDGGEKGFQFIPKEDGTYSILTAYALDYLAGRLDSEIMNAIMNADSKFYIDGEDAYGYVDDYEGGGTKSWLAALTIDLTAGTEYTIGVSSYGDAPFELYITRMKENLLDCTMTCEGMNEDAVISLTDADGYTMTYGIDYTLYSFVSEYGDVYTVAKGEGDYYGTLYVLSGYQQVVIGGIPEPCVDIELGVPFTYDPEAACYRVTVDTYCNVQLRTADDDYAMFHVFGINEDGSLWDYSRYCSSRYMVTLDAGEYVIEFIPYESYITGELILDVVLDINETSYNIADMTYTGDVLVPQLEIYYYDELLVEGVDYKVGGDVSVIECGSYCLEIRGVGRFSGSMEIYYTVNPDLSSATETLHDGENEIVLSRAGSTNIYKWVPEKTGEYAVACLDIYDVSLIVMNEDGKQLAVMKGYDAVYGFAGVKAGETYYVTAAFSARDMTGSFTLLLEHGKRNFAACTTQVDDVYYVTGEAIEPKPVISYNGQQLTEGVDYTIVTYGANLSAGVGVIEMIGMGNYIGRMTATFDIYFENLIQFAEDEVTEAIINEEYSFQPGDLDDTRLLMFTNTTADTEIFSINWVDSDAVAVLQVYDAAGVPILDFNPDGFRVAAGDTIYLYLVTHRTWWYEEGEVWLKINAADYFYAEYNGLYYMVDSDCNAYLYSTAGDRFTYEIVDQFQYDGQQITVVGCCEDIGDYLYWNQQVFYVSSIDDGIGLALWENGYVAVSLENTSTVAGDADGNGYVDHKDIVLFNGYVCETAVIAEGNLANCDLNQDGAIDYNDLGILLANFVG